MPASQAGRRRFDPGLPLHLFSHLGRFSNFFHSIKPEAGEFGAQFACSIGYGSKALIGICRDCDYAVPYPHE